MEILVALTLALDRTAAYLDAMIDAGERALGADGARADAAIDLRLIEMRTFAARAERSATVLRAAAIAFGEGRLDTPSDISQVDPDATLLQALRGTSALEHYLATGADPNFLHIHVGWLVGLYEPDPRAPARAAIETYEFSHGLIGALPESVAAFIANRDIPE